MVIGNQTVVFEKENDPTILRAPSAGKLMNYLVEDGGHIVAGQPYCEIEVSRSGNTGLERLITELLTRLTSRQSQLLSDISRRYNFSVFACEESVGMVSVIRCLLSLLVGMFEFIV